MPLAFLISGFVLYQLPVGLPDPDPVANRPLVEHSTEVVVIVALMGAGLGIDRPFGMRSWAGTWRLLSATMLLTVVLTTVTAVLLGWPLAAAALLGAVLAPTDPVLASDVQVGGPTKTKSEDEVRFALTSEAGFNDGLAFPLVYAALAMATVSGASWVTDWILVDVVYRLGVGVLAGLLLGWLLGRMFFRAFFPILRLSEYSEGFVALAATFLTYGLTEAVGGYGFVAVFVAARAIRSAERAHGYHRVLHGFIEQVERLLVAWLLLLLGGAVATGVLQPLTWSGAAIGLALLLVIRPATGLLAQLGTSAGPRERGVIAFFGIRGIGSFFYLAYGLGETDVGVPDEELWAVVAFVVLVSVLLHGVTATPVMNRLDRRRRERLRRRGVTHPTDSDLAGEHM